MYPHHCMRHPCHHYLNLRRQIFQSIYLWSQLSNELPESTSVHLYLLQSSPCLSATQAHAPEEHVPALEHESALPSLSKRKHRK